jgi:hypothetical protein
LLAVVFFYIAIRFCRPGGEVPAFAAQVAVSAIFLRVSAPVSGASKIPTAAPTAAAPKRPSISFVLLLITNRFLNDEWLPKPFK